MQSRKRAEKEQKQWAWQVAPALRNQPVILPLFPPLQSLSGWLLFSFPSSRWVPPNHSLLWPLLFPYLTEESLWLNHLAFFLLPLPLFLPPFLFLFSFSAPGGCDLYFSKKKKVMDLFLKTGVHFWIVVFIVITF